MQGEERHKIRMRSVSQTQELAEPRYSESFLLFLFLLVRRGRVVAMGCIGVRGNLRHGVESLLRPRFHDDDRIKLHFPESSNDLLGIFECHFAELS